MSLGITAAGWAAIAAAGVSAAGSVASANAQNAAGRRANGTQMQMYNQTRADQAPWRVAGGQAVNALSQFYGLGGIAAGGPGYDAMAPITVGGSSGGGKNMLNTIDPLGGDYLGRATGNLLGMGGSDPQHVRATIDPRTGQVSVIGDNSQYRSQALTDYLRTGKGLSDHYNQVLDPVISQIDQLRSSGWKFDSATGQGVPPPGYHAPGQTGTGSGAPDYQSILENLPGYQFQRSQGERAVSHSLAAQGLFHSGTGVEALDTFGQQLASGYADKYTQGLAQLAGLGQGSVQSTGNLGQITANQVGSNQIYQGNAQASGYGNLGNAINAGLGGLVQSYGYNQAVNAGAGQQPGYVTPQNAMTYNLGNPSLYQLYQPTSP